MLVRIKVCEIDFCTFHLMGEKIQGLFQWQLGVK